MQLTINWEQIDVANPAKGESQLPTTVLENLKLDPTSYIYQTTENNAAFTEKLAEQSICETPPANTSLPNLETKLRLSGNTLAKPGPKKLVIDDQSTSVEEHRDLADNHAAQPHNLLRPLQSLSSEGIYNPLRPRPVKQVADATPVGAGPESSQIATQENAAAGKQIEPPRELSDLDVLEESFSSTTSPESSQEIEVPQNTEVNCPANQADTSLADTSLADTSLADTSPADTSPVDTSPADTSPADTSPADTSPPGPLEDVSAAVETGDITSAPVGQNTPAWQTSSRVAARPAPVEAGEYDNSIRESVAPDPYRQNQFESKSDNKIPLVVAVKSTDELMQDVWWSEQMKEPFRSGAVAMPLDLDSLLVRTLIHSAQIQVFSELPLIRETAVTEASANFDWHAFTESLWNDVSDPVGSSLTVGGSGNRFRDHKVTAITGVRRRNPVGGQVEFNQEFGHENSNSTYFIPNNQGTARLRMSYTHPLLRGSGRVYNQSLIVLAEVDTSVARDELVRQVSGHLLEVTRAYWGLALERATYLQKIRLYERSRDILKNLEARRELDTYRSQIVRAQAAVSSRESDLIRAEVAIRNAEARIRALVNDAQLGNDQTTELIPMDQPINHDLGVELPETLTVAMQKRPEIAQAFKQIRAASVRQDMTKNELLPTLNLLLTSYVSGLRGNSAAFQAWADQFSVGEPSYSVGINLEVPLGNRAARARDLRRRLELRQFEGQLRLTMETVNLEVGVAVRETNASFQEMVAKYRAMLAAAEDNQYVQKRWELLPGDNANASLVFDELIRTQQRLTEAEREFVAAQTTYNLSLTNLKKAAGILLETEQVATGRTVINGVPTIIFDKSDVPIVGELNAPSLGAPAEILEAPSGENGFPPE